MSSAVPVTVMNVGEVRVGMHDRFVRVDVGVRRTRRIVGSVRMAVVRVVNVSMAVHDRLVLVEMPMSLGEMQEQAGCHGDRPRPEVRRDRLVPEPEP